MNLSTPEQSLTRRINHIRNVVAMEEQELQRRIQAERDELSQRFRPVEERGCDVKIKVQAS